MDGSPKKATEMTMNIVSVWLENFTVENLLGD